MRHFFNRCRFEEKKTVTLSSSRLSNGFVQLSQDRGVITRKTSREKEKRKKNTQKNTSWEREGVATLLSYPKIRGGNIIHH